jgi:hypothetical protein
MRNNPGAGTIGIPGTAAVAACSELADQLSTHMDKLQLPTFARRNAKPMRDALFAIVEARTRRLR